MSALHRVSNECHLLLTEEVLLLYKLKYPNFRFFRTPVMRQPQQTVQISMYVRKKQFNSSNLRSFVSLPLCCRTFALLKNKSFFITACLQRCCYITTDSATTALQNGARTNECISKQMHHKTSFSHNGFLKSLEFCKNNITLFCLEKKLLEILY